MAILRYTVMFLPLLLLTGCYEDFNPDIDTEPVLCLNSLIKAGEPIEVEVTHTWMFNDGYSEKNHEVTDAVVTLFANDKAVGPDYLPREGDKIRIEAESPTYGKATAEVTVPVATPIGDVRVSPVVTNVWNRGQDSSVYEMFADVTFNLNIEMDVNDQAGTDNYYQFGYDWISPVADEPGDDDMLGWTVPVFSIGKFEYDAEPIFKEHVGVFETVMGTDEETEFVFFSDRQFPGKRYTLHLNFSNNSYYVRSQDYDESLLDCRVNLYLISVSRSYYSWAVYKWNVEEGITGGLSDIGLAEARWGYSNVSTGAGVVAACSMARYTVDLKDFFEEIVESYRAGSNQYNN